MGSMLNMLALLHNVPNSLQIFTHSAKPSSCSIHFLLRLNLTFLQQELVVIQATTLSLSKEEPVRHSIPMSDRERKEMM